MFEQGGVLTDQSGLLDLSGFAGPVNPSNIGAGLHAEMKKLIVGAHVSDPSAGQILQEWISVLRETVGGGPVVNKQQHQFQGWLLKQNTGMIRFWKQYWFQLYPGELSHWSSDSRNPEGTLRN